MRSPPRPAATAPAPAGRRSAREGLRPLLGLVLTGYGLLVLARVLPHDSTLAGVASLAAGLAVLAFGLPALGPPRRRFVAALGCACVGGVAGHALAVPNGLGVAEMAIVAYGLLMMAAAFQLHRRMGGTDVGTLVAWSLPLALTPLALFALNGVLTADGSGAAASPVVEAMVVAPTAAALQWLGTPVVQVGSTLQLATPRGALSLGVGLVCAGLYPVVMFGGLVALHAWRAGLDTLHTAVLVFNGVAGLWLLNLVRLVVLTQVGIRWGMDALQAAHANLGWLLFGGFMAAFWYVVLRHARPAHALPSA